MRKYKAVSLFSGAMGLDFGLDQTNRFEFLACVEKEQSFCESIRANQSKGLLNADLRIYNNDIKDVSPEQLMKDLGLKPGELDLIVGGP